MKLVKVSDYDIRQATAELPSAVALCEHHWINKHQPDFPPQIYWIRQCSLCSRIDGKDIADQVATPEATT